MRDVSGLGWQLPTSYYLESQSWISVLRQRSSVLLIANDFTLYRNNFTDCIPKVVKHHAQGIGDLHNIMAVVFSRQEGRGFNLLVPYTRSGSTAIETVTHMNN
jgi:hypothetical protein